jgi:hypothetical protein
MTDVNVPILVEIFSGVSCNPILHEVFVVDDNLVEKNGFLLLIKAAGITVPCVI